MGKPRGRNERERMSQYFRSWCSAFPVAAGVSPAISSRVTFSLDLHDFRGASILKRNRVAQMLRAARSDVIGGARRQSRRRSLPSAALRKIDIFFDKRPAHSKEYRTIVSFSVPDFAEPMSNSLLSLPKACSPWRAAGERF